MQKSFLIFLGVSSFLGCLEYYCVIKYWEVYIVTFFKLEAVARCALP